MEKCRIITLIFLLVMDETKLTKKDKEELLESAKELITDFAETIKEKIDELAEMVKKC